MIQIKKTILTLVALLAVTTGAWAQTETLLTTITATAKEQASYSTANVATVSFSYTAGGSSAYLANWGWWGYGWSATVTAAEGYTITKCIFYDDANRTATDSEAPFVVETTLEDKTPQVNGTPILADQSKGIKKIEVYGYVTPTASSGPEVAWDKTTNTGTFNMPGGNVTLQPEYYPQAELTAAPTAINDVPATTDGAIVNAGTVANIGETATAQGTVMYYVSTTALDDAALLALAADQWTADVPTAESLAEGQAYVYYYVRGNDGDTDETTFSDGDILAANALTVTIAAEPTYAVTFADDTAEPDKWTADPNAGVKKGQTVTVTYTGTKKIIGVKAEKKAATVPVTAITLNKTATSIKVGSTETLSVTAVAPDNATDKTYTWKTSDESKATVDQDGKVTAVAAGTVTIYAEANDGSGVKGNCTVTVTPAIITVTWNNNDITGTWGKSFTKDGVTITAGYIDFDDKNFMEGGTFSTTLGNFTKIEVTTGGWYASGTGWSGSGHSGTWTGNASSVSFSGDIMGMAMGNTKFVFTIEPTN